MMGCVIARSNEAKDLGIGMGEPYFKVKHHCQQSGLMVCSANHTLYCDMSQRVMQSLGNMPTRMEPSIVLMKPFVDFSGIPDVQSCGAAVGAAHQAVHGHSGEHRYGTQQDFSKNRESICQEIPRLSELLLHR